MLYFIFLVLAKADHIVKPDVYGDKNYIPLTRRVIRKELHWGSKYI